MADLVPGLAKSALEGTLTMVKSAIEEEKKLKKDVQRDLMVISDEFEMMRSVLINVSKDRVTDDVTNTVVRQVRDMALQVEDCIESAVHLDGRSNWWRRMLPSCVPSAAPAIDLDAAVADIELLKARVEAMGLRNLRYSRIGDFGPKPGGEQRHQQAMTSATASDSFVRLRYAAEKQRKCEDLVMLINRKGNGGVEVDSEEVEEEQREVGNKLEAEQEIEEEVALRSNSSTTITAARQLQVISVLGARNDLGTMLIKKAYDDQETCNSFRCRAWVKMMHPFNRCEFIRSLRAQFYKNYGPQEEVDPLELVPATDALLIEAEFKKQMNSHRYIIVLEGMSTMADWEAVRVYLPDKNNGSCIVVHTQQLEIASCCVGHPHQVSEAENSLADDSLYVFFKEDAPGKVEETVPDKKKTAREWLNEHKLVGRPGHIINLYGEDDVGMVDSTWGMSGVGKSFLGKRTYYVLLADGYDPGHKIGWVDVSHPFNLMDLSRRLLLDLDPVQHHKMLAIEDPILVCRKYLHKHKFYIFIDGLQSTEDWDMTKAALGLETVKGVIFVITTEESVAKHCASFSGNVQNVTCLDFHGASELLEEKVQLLGSLLPFNPLGTEEKRRIIVHKCGGLPKVICAVVDMYTKCEIYMDTSGVWRDNLVSMLEANAALMTESLQDLFAWLHSYFRSCPDFLKPCIFYLTIFPLEHIIRRRRLVRRWIAEGYARDNKESTAEENGEMFFSKLLYLSMIQAPSYWLMLPLFQVNGFLREYIISRSMEENLVFALKDHSSKNLQRTGRHLAIDESWDRDRNVFESIDFSRLRSLTVFGEWRQFFISEKMRLLRVLDLEDMSSGLKNGDVEQMVKLLPRLKFLSLRRCREITHLPDSLGDLKQLQTLDIRYTCVIKLPKSIIKLEKLQFIRAGRQYLSLPVAAAEDPSTSSASRQNGVKVPRGIGRLSNMHTLGVVNIRDAGVLEELKKLTQLHKLGVSGINRKNTHKLFSAISGLIHLRSLSLQVEVDEDNQLDCLDRDSRKILENLKSLKLYGPIRKLPEWTKELLNVKKLSLQITTLTQDGFHILDNLRKLKILRLFLSEFQNGKLQFGPQNDEFQRSFLWLEFLEISCNSRLQATITFPEGGAKLHVMVLRLRCWGEGVSSLRISGLQHLRDLKEVWLSGSWDDAHKQHFQDRRCLRDPPRRICRINIRPVLFMSPSALYCSVQSSRSGTASCVTFYVVNM